MNMLNCPDVLTVQEAGEVLRAGLTTMYRLVQNGRLQRVKIWRNVLIPRVFLQYFLECNGGKDYNKDVFQERITPVTRKE